MKIIFGILGIAGGILRAVGDILFDLKGKGNKKLGTSGNIDSNWVNMPYWRFGASILVAFLGDALSGSDFTHWQVSLRTEAALLRRLRRYAGM